MRVNFYPDRSKGLNTIRTIWASIYERKNILLLNTGERVDTAYWDKKTHRASIRMAKNPGLKSQLNILNQFLNAYEHKIQSISLGMKTENPLIEFTEIANEIKREFGKTSNTLYDIFEDFIKAKRTLVGKQTIYKYNQLKNVLQAFEKKHGQKLSFNSFNKLFYDKFLAFLIDDRKMINATAYKTISFLKTFLGWAYERKLTTNTDFKYFKGKSYENEVVYLTEEELMNLYNLKIKEDRLSKVRDTFLFQCFTGQRYSDILALKKEDIKNGTWHIRQQKTKSIIQIPLNNYALSILSKYPDYRLPVISNQKINKYLKELCILAEIDEPVTLVKFRGNKRIEENKKKYEVIGTHTARRTFITLSLRKGMQPEVIMKITGHKSYRMFQKYLKIADDHTRKEMFEAWGEPLHQIDINKSGELNQMRKRQKR